MEVEKGSVTTPAGFKAAGTSCGFKSDGTPDLGLLVSSEPASLGAVFTRNRVKAAPVLRGMRLIDRGSARAFLVNSGCANACTGEEGLNDVAEMAEAVADVLGISPGDVFVSSTGKIGTRLDIEAIRKSAPLLVDSLSETGGEDFARAIMTTDTRPKTAAVTIELEEGNVSIGGCAKGSGMICPDMATMLAFLTTDAELYPDLLMKWLRDAVGSSFNRITIDGHTSPNDTVAIMANGASGIELSSERDGILFREGLEALCGYLAKEIVRDGEGASRLVEVVITGAVSHIAAERMVRKIAESPLVKCAMHGADPNWGRIISAAGYAGVDFDSEDATLDIGPFRVFENGMPAEFDRRMAAKYMGGSDIQIVLSLSDGSGGATMWTCDLSPEYVNINTEYN